MLLKSRINGTHHHFPAPLMGTKRIPNTPHSPPTRGMVEEFFLLKTHRRIMRTFPTMINAANRSNKEEIIQSIVVRTKISYGTNIRCPKPL
jgi:hypothetical protein